jgi:HK97 family phage prohead protease
LKIQKGDNNLEHQSEYENGQLDLLAEIKAVQEDDSDAKGEFEGYASVFNNVDLGNDVVEKGAFTSSIRKKGASKIKMLYQHDVKQPIGVFDKIKEDEEGLYVKGRLAMGTQKGREVYELMKMGALDGLSVGYRVDAKGYEYDKGKRRKLKKLDLMEISAVTFPMNPNAQVMSVKGERSIREWETFLREEGGLSRSESKMGASALCKALNQREVGDSQNNEIVAKLRNLTEIIKK